MLIFPCPLHILASAPARSACLCLLDPGPPIAQLWGRTLRNVVSVNGVGLQPSLVLCRAASVHLPRPVLPASHS